MQVTINNDRLFVLKEVLPKSINNNNLSEDLLQIIFLYIPKLLSNENIHEVLKAYLSDDENMSYRRMISMAIKTYKENGVKVGFCGQQPSDSIEFCKFLIGENIDTISVTPDSALKTIQNLGKL